MQEPVFLRSLQRERHTLRRWSYLSPAPLAQQELDRLSGFDAEQQYDFMNDAAAYLGRLRGYYWENFFPATPLTLATTQWASAYPAFQSRVRSYSSIALSDELAWIVLLIGLLGCACSKRLLSK